MIGFFQRPGCENVLAVFASALICCIEQINSLPCIFHPWVVAHVPYALTPFLNLKTINLSTTTQLEGLELQFPDVLYVLPSKV